MNYQHSHNQGDQRCRHILHESWCLRCHCAGEYSLEYVLLHLEHQLLGVFLTTTRCLWNHSMQMYLASLVFYCICHLHCSELRRWSVCVQFVPAISVSRLGLA